MDLSVVVPCFSEERRLPEALAVVESYLEGGPRSFNLLVQSLLLPGIWDTQCGFKLLRGDVARELAGQLRIEGFAYDVELLYLAKLSGYRVCEIPVRWVNSDITRVSALRDSRRMLRDVVRLRLRR